jgi:hypothetical protein
MKRPGFEVHASRIPRIAKRFFLLPRVVLTAPGKWAKGLLFRFQHKSAQELAAFDQLRRSTVHREPRRLPPNPIAEPTKLT